VGLWETGEGCIARPAHESLLVVPEDPYPAPATLRELLGGSETAAPPSDADVQAALRGLGVEDIVARAGGLDAELPWDAASPEERRLLAIARALIAPPRFAVLVHPADGLGAARASAALAALAARGIGYVVLDEEALGPEHFDAVVTITADGGWTRTPA
jgi:putative ATP-binding cassette transporter